MLTATIVFIGCGLIIKSVAMRRIREYKEERAEILEQSRPYSDHGV
jgi:hypothetical protein